MPDYIPVSGGLVSPIEAMERLPEAQIDHERLSTALSLAVAMNEYVGPNKRAYFDTQSEDFARIVANIDGVVGSFGTGYPFYAIDGEEVVPIEELTRYISAHKVLVDEDRNKERRSWPCECCTEVNELADLKTHCKPCKDVSIKPRDIFKSIPDVDYWIIVDEEQKRPDDITVEVVELLEDNGFYHSDSNYPRVLETSIAAMKGVLEGQIPEERLPVDLHIVTMSEFINGLILLPKGLKTGQSQQVTPLSWHRQWERSETYDFTKDFILSLTMFSYSRGVLHELVDMVRRSSARIIEDPVSLAGALDDKDKRRLATPALAKILNDRIATWQNR